jgi:hypothetical protein
MRGSAMASSLRPSSQGVHRQALIGNEADRHQGAIADAKDFDHRSRSFGSVFDAHGRVVNSNATPGSHIPPGGRYRPAPMPYFMEFSPAVGMHAGYLPGYPASHGCVRMPRDLAAGFFERVHIGTPVTVVGSTHNLARVRKSIPILPKGTFVLGLSS